MKALIGLIVLGGIGIGIVYMVGGYGSLDPTEQGRQAQAAIKTRMTWSQVIAAAGEPKRYQILRMDKKQVGGRDVEMLVEGGPVKFDRSVFESDMKAGNYKEGFNFQYVFSHQAAFKVRFDPSGNVEFVADEKTMADLLDSRGP
jgi:hypothetical protein